MLTKPVPSTVIKSLILKLLIILLVICLVVAIAKIITDMNNVDFLRFYGVVVIITALVGHWFMQYPTRNQPLPLILTEPDPYKIAYLHNDVISTS